MSGDYKSFSKGQFERILTIYRKEHGIGFWKDVTDGLEKETKQGYWEYVYAVSTDNPKVQILIYSSIDKRTNWTRLKAQDRVRLIYRTRSSKGYAYAKIKRHNRVENLFDTLLLTTLKEASNTKEYYTRKKSKLKWFQKPDYE